MLEHSTVHLNFRTRAASLSVCSTSGVNLEVVADGYVRSSGSFITERYREGMELRPAGFSTAGNNTRAVVARVEALKLTTRESRTVEASASGRTLAVGVPQDLADENVEFEPTPSFQYLEEDYVRGPASMQSMPYNGGVMREDGIYALNWYFLPGFDSMAIHACVDAMLALFAPGTVVGTGANAVTIAGDPGPSATKPEPDGEGWVVVSIEIPFIAHTTNAVAA